MDKEHLRIYRFVTEFGLGRIKNDDIPEFKVHEWHQIYHESPEGTELERLALEKIAELKPCEEVAKLLEKACSFNDCYHAFVKSLMTPFAAYLIRPALEKLIEHTETAGQWKLILSNLPKKSKLRFYAICMMIKRQN